MCPILRCAQTNVIVPRKDSLSNKAQEVNSRIINMCGERDITFVDHTDTIDTERLLNENMKNIWTKPKLI